MNRKHLNIRMAAALLFLAVLLLVVLAIGSEGAQGRQPSTIGLYTENPDDPGTRTVKANEDDNAVFDLVLENYDDGDTENRVVLLYALPDVLSGDEDNWAFSFGNSEGDGEVFYTYDHPTHGELDYFKYLVSGNGTPTEVEFNVTHDYEGSGDNDDRVRYLVRGLDYEEEDEPVDEGERERFLDKIVGKDENNNITYLLDEGEEPNVDYTNELRLEVMVVSDPFNPRCYPERDSMDVVANTSYALGVTVRNDGQQEDELKLEAAVKNDTHGFWNISALAPYTLGDYVELESQGEFTATLLITAPLDEDQAPEGSYELELSCVSKGSGYVDEASVEVDLLQRYDPLIALNSTDSADKIIDTFGAATSFRFNLTNNGTLTDTIALQAEVGDIDTRAGGTNDHWTREFYPTGPLTVAPGETVDIRMNLTPVFDNWKIPPEKYPVSVTASSTNNGSRTDETVVRIRMVDLYSPVLRFLDQPADVIQANNAGTYRLSALNDGQVEDTFSLGLEIRDGEGNLVADLVDPGHWDVSFTDLDTGATIEARQLPPLAPGEEYVFRLGIRPPVGMHSGEYTFNVSITSRGPEREMAALEQPFSIILPDLWIGNWDIVILPDEVEEGDEVIIWATVHLVGSISTPIRVEFFYSTGSDGFVFIGYVDLDFGGKADTEGVAELTWSYVVESTVKVTVDAANDVEEADENNNQATASVEVSSYYTDISSDPACFDIIGPAILGMAFITKTGYDKRKKRKTENR